MATSVPMLADDGDAPASKQEPDTVDDSSQTDTAIIANQAKEIFCKCHPFRRRCDTYFYTIVLGGNTQAIQNAVDLHGKQWHDRCLELASQENKKIILANTKHC